MSEILYLNKKDEVFERCVEVGLLLQLHDGVKVLVVDVGVNPEQALQNGLRHGHEVALKGNTLKKKKNEKKKDNWVDKQRNKAVQQQNTAIFFFTLVQPHF